MPACAMTSTVLVVSRSLGLWLAALLHGRMMEGPNTVAKLCSDILFCASFWLILTMWSIRNKVTCWFTSGSLLNKLSSMVFFSSWSCLLNASKNLG
uniref:Putative secreted protein n=1 Tax=Ixodes ricinus TaxID=34613 RepID=A0A6B0U9U0_IXORI